MNRIAVLVTCLIFVSAWPVLAQDGDVEIDGEISPDPGEVQVVPDWSRACNAKACQLSRGMTEKSSGKPFLTMSVVVRQGADGATLAIATPLGINVQRGVTLGGGRDFRVLPVITCISSGCLVEAPMDEVSLELFASQKSVTISFEPFGKGDTVDLTMPLTGLPDAVQAARKELGG